MSNQKVSIGRIVELFPGKGEDATPLLLPNGMETAPAIVVQVFENHVNLNAFVANTQGSAVITYWSIPHKDNAVNGQCYWDWPAKV